MTFCQVGLGGLFFVLRRLLEHVSGHAHGVLFCARSFDGKHMPPEFEHVLPIAVLLGSAVALKSPLGAPGGTCGCLPGLAANTATVVAESRLQSLLSVCELLGGGSLSVTFYGAARLSAFIISLTQPECCLVIFLDWGRGDVAGVEVATCHLYLIDLSDIFAHAGFKGCRQLPMN